MAAPSGDWRGPVIGSVFDRYDEKYKLCCCHVRNWAIGIGVFELVGSILSLGRGALSGLPANTNSTEGSILLGLIIVGIVWVIIVAVMLFGVTKDNSCMLI